MTIEVRGITKNFSAGGAPAVSDVSFVAPKGAITAVLGPSGAGKSTILRVVAGLEIADRGTVLIEGRDVTETAVQERGIGLVFQSYALFEHLTVRRNIAFGLEIRKVKKATIAARVDELLEKVQLAGYGDRYPSQLSGGQRQRIALARALAVEPKVLLLDEPFGALDARVRQELREWLHQIHTGTRITTLLVTHDQTEALELAEHVVLMFDGKVAQVGTPSELYDRPATPDVAVFFGGGNLLRGKVQQGRAAAGLVDVAAPGDASEGADVQAFVRPHDVTIARSGAGADPDEPTVWLARIERMRRIGGQVKLFLVLRGDERLTVEMPRHEFDALRVEEGDRVLVDTRAARVFVGDYLI